MLPALFLCVFAVNGHHEFRSYQLQANEIQERIDDDIDQIGFYNYQYIAEIFCSELDWDETDQDPNVVSAAVIWGSK